MEEEEKVYKQVVCITGKELLICATVFDIVRGLCDNDIGKMVVVFSMLTHTMPAVVRATMGQHAGALTSQELAFLNDTTNRPPIKDAIAVAYQALKMRFSEAGLSLLIPTLQQELATFDTEINQVKH